MKTTLPTYPAATRLHVVTSKRLLQITGYSDIRVLRHHMRIGLLPRGAKRPGVRWHFWTLKEVNQYLRDNGMTERQIKSA